MKKRKKHSKCLLWKKLIRGQRIGSNSRRQVGEFQKVWYIKIHHGFSDFGLFDFFLSFFGFWFVFWDKISHSPKLSSNSWKLRLALNSFSFFQPLPPSTGITAMLYHRGPITHNSLGKDDLKQTRQNAKIYTWQIHGYSFYYLYSFLYDWNKITAF